MIYLYGNGASSNKCYIFLSLSIVSLLIKLARWIVNLYAPIKSKYGHMVRQNIVFNLKTKSYNPLPPTPLSSIDIKSVRHCTVLQQS